MTPAAPLALRPGVILDRDGTLIDVVRDEETGTVSVAFHPDQLRALAGSDRRPRLARARRLRVRDRDQPTRPGPRSDLGRRRGAHQPGLLALLAEHGIEIAAARGVLAPPERRPGAVTHAGSGECTCRKPKPGLLLNAIEHAGFDATRTWMIGDSTSDVLAAHAAGVRSALVFPMNRCELCPLRSGPELSARPNWVAARFDDLARLIVGA